jgi:ribosomal protein S18 acetylase RimI-like enzyme
LSRRLGVEPWSASKVDVIEDEGGRLDPPKVLLLTRVWDHRKMSGAKAEQWERLNGLRAACIRALSVEFGPQFVGGLAPTPSALRDFPDLVVDASTTRRSAYLGTMKSSRVCVATAGLRDSNGFRLAEYTAASRAIVSEPLSFEVPGPFGAGTHYLPFLFGGVFRGSTIGFVKKERLFLIGRVLRHPLVLSRSVGWKRVGLGVRLLLRRRVPPQAEAPAQVPSRSFGVLAIAVDPGTQGRGVGRLLMAEASERALAQGFRSMHLTVHPGNEQALRFYRDLGWTEVAEPSGEWRGRMRIALEPDSGEPGSTG